MFSRVKGFLSRHKRKFIVGGIVVGGSVLAVRYAQRKIREFQENQAREFLEKTRKTQHFETTERTCNQAIVGLAPLLWQEILKNLDTDGLLAQLRTKPENKLELWDELKILSFTRLTTLIYASSMLVVTLRVQLNLLGGYLYKTVSEDTDFIVSDEVQQNYLGLVQHFIKYGLVDLYKLIEGKVRQVLGNYNLKQKLSLADMEQICWSIQMGVNNTRQDPNTSLAKYVLPGEPVGNEFLLKLYNETLDMLESDEVIAINTNNISRGFSVAIDSIADYYSNKSKGLIDGSGDCKSIAIPGTSKSDLNAVPSSSQLTSNFMISSVELPLAKLIPIINGLVSKEFNMTSKPPSLSTSLISLYLVSDKIKILGANVYEVFSQ